MKDINLQERIKALEKENLKLIQENQNLKIKIKEKRQLIKSKCLVCTTMRSINNSKDREKVVEFHRAKNLGLTIKEYQDILKIKCQYEDEDICKFYNIKTTVFTCTRCKKNDNHFPKIGCE